MYCALVLIMTNILGVGSRPYDWFSLVDNKKTQFLLLFSPDWHDTADMAVPYLYTKEYNCGIACLICEWLRVLPLKLKCIYAAYTHALN